MESSKIVQSFAKTEAGASIRFVCVLRDDARFVFVDETNIVELRHFDKTNFLTRRKSHFVETNIVELRHFDKIEAIVLGQPVVKVTCITALSVNYIVVGCENGELVWFHLNVKQYKYIDQAHPEAVSQVNSDLRVRPSSLRLVSGSVRGSVKVWNVVRTVPLSRNPIWSHDNIHPDPITSLAFVPDSEDIVIGSCHSREVS